MKTSFSLLDYQRRTFLILGLIVFGFIASKALISIGTGLLLVNLVFSFPSHKFRFVKKSNFIILSPILFFIIGFILLPISPDYSKAAQYIWTNLPWLIIPLSIAGITKLNNDFVKLFLAYFSFLIVVSGLVVLGNYFFNYSFYTEQIAVGKHIPTPLNHIRYSLMAAFAGITSIYFLVKKNSFLTKYDSYFFGFASVFIFILLHILSVRSGLVCYYASLGYLIVYFAKTFKKWWLLPVLSVFIIGMPILAYKTIPSFKNKIDYMSYDLEQLGKKDIGHNSDSRRWQSLQIGWELAKEKPIFGHGLGQAENTINLYYQTYFPEIKEQNRKMPHNQFLFTSLELGLVGLAFLLIAFFTPFLASSLFKNPLYFSLAFILFLSCLVENTFESQVGMTFYLIFGSILLKSKLND